MIEASGYPAFSAFPVTGPATSPVRPIATTTGSVRVTLTGADFVVQVQVSNARATNVPEHLFIPPEPSWETVATVQPADEPPLTPQTRGLLFLQSLLGNFLFTVCMIYGVSLTSATSAGVSGLISPCL